MKPFLEHIKTSLGISTIEESFGTELLMYMNAIAITLVSFGVTDLIDVTFHKETALPTFTLIPKLEPLCIAYFVLSLRLVFDPPASDTVLRAIKASKDEIEMRIQLIIGEIEEIPE